MTGNIIRTVLSCTELSCAVCNCPVLYYRTVLCSIQTNSCHQFLRVY